MAAKKDFSRGNKIDSLHEMTRPRNTFDSDQVLIKILDETQGKLAAGLTQVVVFDLDSTLFEVTDRNQRILDEFILSEHLDSHPAIKGMLKNIRMQLSDHGLESAARRAGVLIPDEEIRKKLLLFWRERFFSDQYLETDKPFPGAAEYVQEVYARGAHVIYLTGRDQIRMGVGTPRELRRWKFPLDIERTRLIMKPQKGIDDAEFKVFELEKIKNVSWFFENEPRIIHLVEERLPEIKNVYFESSHSGKADPKQEWIRIKDFKR